MSKQWNCKWATRTQQAINKRSTNDMSGITYVKKTGKYFLSIQREYVERSSVHTVDIKHLKTLRDKWIKNMKRVLKNRKKILKNITKKKLIKMLNNMYKRSEISSCFLLRK